MKKVFSKILIMLACTAFVLPTQAQLLKVVVKDKALQAQTAIPWQKALQFDDKGVAVLENPEITERKELIVELEERKEFFFAIVEPGQTLTLTISLKDDKSQVSYTGKYAAECEYKNADMHFYPSTYIPVKPEKPIDFTAAKAQEEADYKALGKMTDIFPVEKQKMLKGAPDKPCGRAGAMLTQNCRQTIHEERYVANAFHLCTEALDL